MTSWHHTNGSHGNDEIRDENDDLVAEFWTRPSPEHVALMVAAPELLAALKGAMVIIGHPDDAFSMAVARLVAKAEGR